MKRSVLRIGCAVLSLSAAAGLLASCSLLPPASPLPDSKPAQAEEVPGPARSFTERRQAAHPVQQRLQRRQYRALRQYRVVSGRQQ